MAIEPSGRRIVYTNQVPYETDILATNDYIMSAVSALAQTLLGFGIGEATTVRGLACTPVSPPGLAVVVGPGVMYSFEDYDATDFGVIPADTDSNHMLYKQAFNWNPVTLNLTAPATPGDSVIYLIEGIFETVDVNDVSRPYFNSTDPTVPIFNNNYDTRTDKIILVAKQGVPGISPTPPTPTAGYTELYYVTVANGQTSIISDNIVKVSTVEGQPFITQGLTQKASSSDISNAYVTKAQLQQNTPVYITATGTDNAITASPSPAYPNYSAGMGIKVKIASTNSGSATLNISGHGAVTIKKETEAGLVNLQAGDLVAGAIKEFVYDGTNFQLLNGDGQAVVESWNGSTTPVAVSSGDHMSITSGVVAFTGASQLVPTGALMYFAMASAPTGWLHCDGTAVSRTTYANLFSAIGTTWGAGNGSTTFNLPPSARMVLVGSGGSGTGILSNTVGATGGAETHTQTVAEMPSHTHGNASGSGLIGHGGGTANTTAGSDLGTVGLTNTGGGDPFNIMQPSMVGYLCIKT